MAKLLLYSRGSSRDLVAGYGRGLPPWRFARLNFSFDWDPWFGLVAWSSEHKPFEAQGEQECPCHREELPRIAAGFWGPGGGGATEQGDLARVIGIVSH